MRFLLSKLFLNLGDFLMLKQKPKYYKNLQLSQCRAKQLHGQDVLLLIYFFFLYLFNRSIISNSLLFEYFKLLLKFTTLLSKK